MNPTPTFSLIYTSARPEKILGVIDRWESAAKELGRTEWCINTHHQQWMNPCRTVKCVCTTEPPFTSVAGWNNAAKVATGDVLICVADDLEPCQHWDEKLLNFERGIWMLESCCLHVYDGHKPMLMTHPIMTREWYEHAGYFFHPSYSGWYMDNDLQETARALGRLKSVPSNFAQFRHKHHDFGERAKDEHDVADETMKLDGKTFDERQKKGFPVR